MANGTATAIDLQRLVIMEQCKLQASLMNNIATGCLGYGVLAFAFNATVAADWPRILAAFAGALMFAMLANQRIALIREKLDGGTE